MAIKDKIFYNEASAAKLGWEPSWLGQDDFDDDLIKAIEQFQKNNRMKVDGLLGPQTFKKLYTRYEAIKEWAKNQLEEKNKKMMKNEFGKMIEVGFDNKQIPIEWNKFVGLKDEGNLALPSKTFKTSSKQRLPKMFVIHHDVCLSSKSCYEVLKRRNLSVQFSIDNDGTIYQMTTLNDIAQHAGRNGNVSYNALSIGVEISNAVETIYQNHYKMKGFGERPIIKKFKCHNKNYGDILGIYPIQIAALKQLIKAICSHYPEIQLQCPIENDENVMGNYKDCLNGTYSGICCHYHLDPNKDKWDCAGIDLKKIIQEITSESLLK